MRIQFDNCDLSSSNGPSTFGAALARSLFAMGHEVTFNSNADVSLVFIEPTGRKLTDKVVLRLDGVWNSPSQHPHANKRMMQAYNVANAVVFQSEFDKRIVTQLFGEPHLGAVIRNGTDAQPAVQHKYTGLDLLRQEHDLVFSCSAMWHRQKRLKENVELFKHVRSLSPEKKCCLIVLGQINDQETYDLIRHDPGIFYAGYQPIDVCLEVYSMSHWFLHLSFGEHCANTVVHALSQETPVICTNFSGTPEIVGDFGVVLHESEIPTSPLYDYDNPPLLDVTQVTSLPDVSMLGKHANVTIEYVAKQYIKLFEIVK